MNLTKPLIMVEASVEIALPSPRMVSTARGLTIIAKRVQWRHWVGQVDGKDYDHTSTVLYASNHDNVAFYSEPPSWVPRPPAGWDANVLAICESEQVSA